MNSGRAGGGILCRMLFNEFHRRRGLSEFYLLSLLDPNLEYLNETIHNQFCLFFGTIFFPFNFVLQLSISNMTAIWSEIPDVEKTELIELEVGLVIKRSTQ